MQDRSAISGMMMDESPPTVAAESLRQQLSGLKSFIVACENALTKKCCHLIQVLKHAQSFFGDESGKHLEQSVDLIEDTLGAIQYSQALFCEELDDAALLGQLYTAAEAMLHITAHVLYSTRWGLLLPAACLKRYHTDLGGALKEICKSLNSKLIQQLSSMDLSADEGDCPAVMSITEDVSSFLCALFQLAEVSCREAMNPSPSAPAVQTGMAVINATWTSLMDHLQTLQKHDLTIPCLQGELPAKVVDCCLQRLHESLLRPECIEHANLVIPRYYLQHALRLSKMFASSFKAHLHLLMQTCKASRQMVFRREGDNHANHAHIKILAVLGTAMNTACEEEGKAFIMDLMQQWFAPIGMSSDAGDGLVNLYFAEDLLTRSDLLGPAVRCVSAAVVLPWMMKAAAVQLHDQMLADEDLVLVVVQACITFFVGCAMQAAQNEDVASQDCWELCQSHLFELVLERHPMVQSILEDVWSTLLSEAEEQLALHHLHTVMEVLKAVAAVEVLGGTRTAQTCPMATQVSCLLARLLQACAQHVRVAICTEVLTQTVESKAYIHAVHTAGWVLIMSPVVMCPEMKMNHIANWLNVLISGLQKDSSTQKLLGSCPSTGRELTDVNTGWMIKGLSLAAAHLMDRQQVGDARNLSGVCQTSLTRAAQHVLSLISSWQPDPSTSSHALPAWLLAALSFLDLCGGLLPAGLLDSLVTQLRACRQDPAMKLHVMGVLKHFSRPQRPVEELVQSMIANESEWPLVLEYASMIYTLTCKGVLPKTMFSTKQFMGLFAQQSNYEAFKKWLAAVVGKKLDLKGSFGEAEEYLAASWREEREKLGTCRHWDTAGCLEAAEARMRCMYTGEQVHCSCSDTPQGRSIQRLKPIVSKLQQCILELGEATNAVQSTCCTTGIRDEDSRALQAYIREMTQSACVVLQHSENMTQRLIKPVN